MTAPCSDPVASGSIVYRRSGSHHAPRLTRTGILAGVTAAALTMAASGAAVAAEDAALPAVTGTSIVGRTELTLNDTGRQDPFAEDGRSRELAIWIWYPAVEGSTGEAAPYLPPVWAELANGAGLVSLDLNAVRTNALADAPLDGRPPVVVLMPGLGQPVAAYSALAEDLASHGYAVVGINPTGSTSVVVFPDGHIIPGTASGSIDPALLADLPGWSAAAGRITNVWVADLAFVVDTLAASPPAIGALDFTHVAYLGHSLGGAASFQACADDPRCAAAIDLDGTLWTDVRHTGLDTPILLVQAEPAETCDAFCDAAASDFAMVEAGSPTDRVSIAGSRHLSFTDLGLLSPVPGVLDLGSIDAERMTAITRDLVRSFLDEHVKAGDAGTFQAAVARHPEVH